MRYSRQEDLLRLAIRMQGTAEGISLADIERDHDVSRRTAERMRDALLRAFPAIEEVPAEGGQKFWRLPPGTLGKMAEPTLEELGAGQRAAAISRREGDEACAAALESLLAKVQAMFTRDRRRRIAADLEAQLLADGVAFRPGPREKIAPEILKTLREAILAGVMISADHRARGTRKLSRNTRLGPIAVLFGQGRQYLLAWSEYQNDLRLFALTGFERVATLDEVYARPEGFDVQDWLAEGFGMWRDTPVEVEWRFSPEVADEAAGFAFHPRQQTEHLADGALMVRFRACGQQEMEWYLARWGDKVEARYRPIAELSGHPSDIDASHG